MATVMPRTIEPADWQGNAGTRWASNVDHFETMLAPVGQAFIDHCGFAAGERVIEIGCGGGALTRAIAARVMPGGSVLGLDISDDLVALATARATAEGAAGISFAAGDAQVVLPPGVPFDRLMSRFGVMFFADPGAALANLHAMLIPGGRLDFAVWAGADRNPQFTIMGAAARTHFNVARPDPRAPGPLAFSEPAYLEALLREAGFGGIAFTEWTGELPYGGEGDGVAEGAEKLLRTGSLADAATAADDATIAAARAEIADMLDPYMTVAGLRLPAAVHLVTARA